MSTPFADKILYELLVHAEWKLEPELARSSKAVAQHVQSLPFLISRFSSILRRQEVNPIINSLSWQVPWKLATGGDGQVVAILQDTFLEIRTVRDEYTSVVGKANVQRDAWPHLRRLEWSPDCSMVALANSNGSISAFDLLGSTLFVIPPDKPEPFDSTLALAALIFIDIRFKSAKWSHELISIDFNGTLLSYLVSSSGGYQSYHRWNFPPLQFWKGISCVTYHQKNHMLVVGSPIIVNSKAKENWQWGISSWRLINDAPYYREAVPASEVRSILDVKYTILSWVPLFNSSLIDKFIKQSAVFRVRISPQGNLVACLHSCGTISIWHLPSLRLYKLWRLEDQPDYDLQNQLLKRKTRSGASNSTEFHPVDINWWCEKNLTIARYNGAVTVCCIDTMQNLLGESPEFLSSQPQLSSTSSENGFLALECQLHPFKSKPNASQEDETHDSSEDEEKPSIWSRSSDVIRSTCFFFTDSERFKPKRKRPKLVYKIYQLLAIISRTPEELFTRMIESENYEEALNLAEVYNLDADRVYQSQWRKTPVSVSSIHNFLSKIHSKTWVLHECCERVPETLSAVRELISFGLKYTDLSAVFKDEDVPSPEPFNLQSMIDAVAAGDLSNFSVDVGKLSDDVKQMISSRKKLLKLSDRLFTYQTILESSYDETSSAEVLYDRETYDIFQKSSIIESAIQYARKSDINAISVLLTYHGCETLPFWLNILENIPETFSALNYKDLLPQCTEDSNFVRWEQKQIRSQDWCESTLFSSIGDIDMLTVDCTDKSSDLNISVIYDWYRNRICAIEKNTNLVNRALDLLKVAKEKQVKYLGDLEFELNVLNTLVYDVCLESITLESLQKKSLEEKLKLLMSATTTENFIENLKNLLIPFLDRCEAHQPGSKMKLISMYFLDLSEKRLDCLLKLVQFVPMFDSLFDGSRSVFPSTEEFVSVTIKCIYHCKSTDEIDRASFIISLLPQTDLKNVTEEYKSLLNDLKILEAEITCSRILKKHHIELSLDQIHKIKDDFESVFLLLSGMAKGKNVRQRNFSHSEWNQLLLDILQLHSLLFSCLNEENCYEIYASILLNNGQSSNIMFAANVLCCNPADASKRKISFAKSLDIVLNAARNYFNNSATVDENSMALAKVCLRLMPEDKKEISEELDLIAAAHMLSDLKVVLLPMQVRLCTDRMKMIELCLKSREDNYCKTDKLFKLAKLLRIHDNNTRLREAVVLQKCIEVAFEAKNYSFCGRKCLYFIEEEQPLGWEICRQVADCENYKDLDTRKSLAVFALAYCPPSCISEIIQMKHNLEYKILRSSIQNQMTEAVNETSADVSLSESTFLQSMLTDKVQNLTSALFNNKLSKVFWDYTSSKDVSIAEEEIKNDDLKHQGIAEFYSAVHEQCDCLVISKTSHATLDMNLALLTQCLFELKSSTPDISMENSFSKLLANCAELTISEDSLSSLYFLLSVRNFDEIEMIFNSFPQTPFVCQLGILLFAFRICLKLSEFKLPMTPKAIVALAEKNYLKDPESFKFMQKFKKSLDDVKESQKLEVLDCGIDVARFARDETYKMDSILGLAMSDQAEQFYLAIQLGATHNVSLTEIAVCHVTSFLFGCTPNLVEKISSNDLLIKLLKEDQPKALEKLDETFYNPTDGTNHNGLLAYFSVLNIIAEDISLHNLVPKEHLKLIKKVKATSALIDYKRLVAEPSSVVKVFEPALNEQSVNSILKLIKVLPSFLKDSVSFSQFYSILVNKIYSKEDGSNEIDKLTKCIDYLNKMEPKDIIAFIKKSLLSEKCVKNNSLSQRLILLENIILLCQKKTDYDFSEALNFLQTSYDRLQAIESFRDFCLENYPDVQPYMTFIDNLDVYHTDSNALRNVFFSALVSLPSVPLVDLLKSSEKLNCDFSLKTIIHEAILCLKDNVENISAVLLRINECVNNKYVDQEWIHQLEALPKFHFLPPKQKVQLNHIISRLKSIQMS